MKNIMYLIFCLSILITSCGDSCEEITWYQDINQNGKGNPDVTLIDCAQPEGYVNDSSDLHDSCNENVVILPYWELCASVDICSLDKHPVLAMLGDNHLLSPDGYSYKWTNTFTNVVTNGEWSFANNGESILLEITFPDGCVYEIEYNDECE